MDSGIGTAQKSLSSFAGKLKTGLATAAKVGVAALGAASTAIAALTKVSLDQYSEYEQLVGGVETLFKKNADTVIKYAQNAYKTAGMSANGYMETVTSFSASLLQGLGGDTKRAAEVANQAVTDMSDNANKMGTSIGLIQNAYQGFAKQNYTMLDNLKLGYGGTQAEMARLINDSGVLGDTMTATAENVNQVSFDKIIEAIHVVQTNMGITGTTAREASSTIEGSVASMKAAWTNLVTGIADENADLDTLISNFVSSVKTAGDNIIPRVEQILSGIGQMIVSLAPIIAQEIPLLAAQIIPPMISAGVQLLGGLIQGAISVLPQLPAIASEIIQSLTSGVSSALPQIADSGTELIAMLSTALTVGFPTLVQNGVNAAVAIIGGLASGLSENVQLFIGQALPLLMEFSGQMRENAGQLVDAGLNLIMQLADGIISSIPALIQTVPTIVTNIAGIINDNAPKLLAAGLTLIGKLAQGLIEAIPVLLENIPKIFQAVVSTFMALNWVSLGQNVVSFIKNGIQTLQTAIPDALRSIGEQASQLLRNLDWADLGTEILTLIGNGIYFLVDSIPNLLVSIGESAVQAFKSIDWLDLGTNLIAGIIAGINGALGGLLSAAVDMGRGLLKAFKGFFGINSPSKVMMEQGGYIVDGLINGIKNLPSALEKVLSSALSAVKQWASGLVSQMKSTASNLLGLIKTNWDGIKTAISNALSAIKSTVSNVWSAIKTAISNAVNAIKTTVTNIWNGIKNTVSTVMSGIQKTVTNAWNTVKSNVSNVINNVKSTISNGLNSAKSTVSNVLDGIKNKFSSIFESAKNIVKNAIDRIKGMFHFSWSLPKLKLPHFSVKGKFSLNPPSVPSFGISWYKKAMDNAMILNGATIFGASNGKLLGGGESGQEVVSGADTLMRMIQSAVRAEKPAATGMTVNITVNGAKYDDERKLAKAIAQELQYMTERSRSSFA